MGGVREWEGACVCERYGWMRTVLSYPLFVHIMCNLSSHDRSMCGSHF